MGRLQRKKPAAKKKKKKKKLDAAVSPGISNNVVENKPSSFAGALKNSAKGQAISQKKSIVGLKPAQKKSGNGYLDKGLQFLREVKIELKKVTWPSRTQTMGSTLVVIVLVMIISLFLGVVDFGLSSLVRVVLH